MLRNGCAEWYLLEIPSAALLQSANRKLFVGYNSQQCGSGGM